MSAAPFGSVHELAIALASFSSLSLMAMAVTRPPRGFLHWTFGVGMAAFAAEAMTSLMLLTRTIYPAEHLLWLRLGQVVGLFLPIPWAFFVASLTGSGRSVVTVRWRIGLAMLTLVTLAVAAAVMTRSAFDIFNVPGPFDGAGLTRIGQSSAIVQLLATVAILGALEACLRTSQGVSRWRIKYLIVGLGGIFLARFYLLSEMLLLQIVKPAYLTTASLANVLGNVLIAVSLIRDRGLATDFRVSRRFLYRSAVVGVLGLYLLVVGVLSWTLNQLGLGQELFWESVVVFASAMALAVLLLSEDARWRIQRWIARHFYRSKYDYREQWVTFTKRLGSLLTLDELAPQVVRALVEAVGATRATLYLHNDEEGAFSVAATHDLDGRSLPGAVKPDTPLAAQLRTHREPFFIDHGQPTSLAPDPEPEGGNADEGLSIAVPLYWRGALTGVMLLGPERTGARYSLEDLEFLSTVGQQVAGAIATAELSEALASTREFEAFHRLTSFVIHDLKNSISALSMLSQNALTHFHDRDFQRDSIRTLSRTVDRMRALLAKLSTRPELTLHFDSVDLPALVRHATAALDRGERVPITKILEPVPGLRGDAEALHTVVQNLVTNAMEALGEHGEVAIKTYTEGGHAVLEVRDNGCGIPDEFRRKWLFAPFRTTKKGGCGIGLYQVRTIVDGHGGTIDVISREGYGTTFSVRLPVVEAGSEP